MNFGLSVVRPGNPDSRSAPRTAPVDGAARPVWIHLGILRTRGGELVASCNLLYCLVASDASCGTLLGALVLERRYRSCCWTDRISPPFIGCGTDGCIKIFTVCYSGLQTCSVHGSRRSVTVADSTLIGERAGHMGTSVDLCNRGARSSGSVVGGRVEPSVGRL